MPPLPITGYSAKANARIYFGDNCFLLSPGIGPDERQMSVSSMEESTMSSDTRSGSGFSWFLAGLGLGSLLGVLYAPKAGEETREELLATALGQKEYLRQRSQDAAQFAGDYVERGRGQVNDYAAKGRDQLNHYVSRGRDVVETGRQKINEAYNQGVQAVAEQKEKIAASYAAGKQAYEETSAPRTGQEELVPKSEHLS